MSDDLRAAEALAALQQLDAQRIEYKADIAPAVLDIDNRDVTTLFSVDCLDSVGDITEVSAFRKSIGERSDRIPHLYMHDLGNPAIARIMSFQPLSRTELPTDVQREHADATGGMACVSRYLKSGRGAEVYEGIKDGIPYQASFGYSVVRAETKVLSDQRKARVIKELRLFEVSTTAPGHAANAATRTRLGKAYAILEELKAGWRHGRHGDIETLNQMVSLLIGMGATNATLIDAAPAHDAPRTSAWDGLIDEVSSIFEVSDVSLRSTP
jgi:phage head maturation protease